MKPISAKNMIMALCLFAGASVSAQTINVVMGDVTYAIPANQAGEMIYANGTTLTIMNKEFQLSKVDEMFIDDSEVVDNSVDVMWQGAVAKVRVAGNVAQYLTVTVDGADVKLLQNASLTNEITYTLSGLSSDGSLYMDGELKATFVLDNLNLTNADDYAINIENGKRIDVILKEGSVNYLADGATTTSGVSKGAMMVNGHTEFDGDGKLTISGNYAHAFWGDEYVKVKKGLCEIVVDKAVKDGFNVNQYFLQNGGSVTISGVGDDGIQVSKDDKDEEYNGMVLLNGGKHSITCAGVAAKAINAESDIVYGESADGEGGEYSYSTTGGGEYDSASQDTKAAACVSTDADIVINSGTITTNSTGAGGKGLKADSLIVINGGVISVVTKGTQYSYNRITSSPKGIKATLNLEINGGKIDVNTSGGEGSEGIESKADITINGGTVVVNSYDDAINSAKNLYIKGGEITAVATNNDALDSNNNLYVSGGKLMAFGGRSPECGLDAAEGYAMYFTGGEILSVGGSAATPTKNTSTQAYVTTTGSVTASTTIKVTNGDTVITEFVVPANYSSSSGGSSGGGWRPGGSTSGSNIMVSAPGILSGQSYKMYNGSTSSTVTAKQYGNSRF